MSGGGLDKLHLADLHSLASAAGIERYRMLPRTELVAALEQAGVEAPQGLPTRERLDGGERRSAGRGDRPVADVAPDATGTVSGALQVTRRGHGFVVTEDPDEDDVYVSASQIRRCSLRAGDQVAGPWRGPRRGERHRALTKVEEVNGETIVAGPGAGFDELTPVAPHRRLELAIPEDDVLLRATDRLAPFAYGQRVLVVAEPHVDRSTLLRSIARAAAASESAPDPLVLLIDERPEDLTAWRQEVSHVEIEATAADEPAAEHRLRAERVMGRVRRRVERGEEALLIVDSLSRLAALADLDTVKALFGSGRETAEEGAGSLTVVASVVVGTGAELADRAYAALATTETSTIVLDPALAAAGFQPALDVQRTRTVPEPPEAQQLRTELSGLDGAAAAERLRALLQPSA